jgi:hypothetical protein
MTSCQFAVSNRVLWKLDASEIHTPFERFDPEAGGRERPAVFRSIHFKQ